MPPHSFLNSSPGTFPAHPELDMLLQEARQAVRRKHLSVHTEDAYTHTTRRFLDFYGRRHPRQLGAAQIRDYRTHLAVERTVAASTPNVARNAPCFPPRERVCE